VFGIGAVMIFISIFIISNTIKLAVYSNRREIYIMKYIGATSKFIETPFITEGVLMGIGSAMLSWVITSLAYITAYARLPKVGSTIGIFGFVPYSSFWYFVMGAFVILGIILGGLGSSIATKRYLKECKPCKQKVNKNKKYNQDKVEKKDDDKKKIATENIEDDLNKTSVNVERTSRRNRTRKLKNYMIIIALILIGMYSGNKIIASTTQENIEEIKKQQSATTKKYNEITSDMAIYNKQIDSLDSEIDKYSKQVDTLNAKISTISKEVGSLESELQTVSVGYQSTQDLYNTRLRVLYENGFVNIWQVLFTSSSITDFLSKYNVVVTLLDYDQKLLNAMQSQKEYIDSLKKDAELRKLQIEQIGYDVTKSKQALEIAKSSKEAKIKQLESSQNELKSLQVTLKKQLNAMERKLAAELAAARGSYKGVFVGFSWPVEGSSKLTTYFNEAYNPFGTGTRRHYWGIDLARNSAYTTHIYSIAAGKVAKVGYDPSGWGKYVIVSHGKNENDGATYVSQYSHLKSVSVKQGQIVAKGQTVGIMGTTGASTGYHLDLILKRNSAFVNPLKYIPHKLSNGWYSAM
jgi:murein DD-endopeptidase MepM/ murein hydrolase activator NlpD